LLVISKINIVSTDNLKQFIGCFKESIEKQTFVKLSLMNKRNKPDDLKTVSAKIIQLKAGQFLQFVYRHNTKDITKNYSFAESETIVESLINSVFLQAELYTLEADYHLTVNKKNIAVLKKKEASIKEIPLPLHDKEKQRLIKTADNNYLYELGVVTADAKVKNSMQDKYRQINKYIEIIDGVLRNTKLSDTIKVVDMGAGKAYLTFALYDYLKNVLKISPEVVGIELRKELVEECNRIAVKSEFEKLSFKTGSIMNTALAETDMLIALHACDTATDDAIFRGINAGAKIIICAPCCHKQLRKQMNPTDDLKLITQFGILKERQAELLTDGIRALILEAYGYKTKVFEFIATEHTPKNVLIVAIKHKNFKALDTEILKKIENIKRIHGIEYHYLEKLFDKE